MSVKKLALALGKKYGTRNPFAICDILGIKVIFKRLEGTRGFFLRAYGVDTIYIDERLPGYFQTFVCAHELAHALLHAELNAVYLDTRTYQVMGKYEKAANQFAAYFLWPDDDELLEYVDYPLDRLSTVMGMPAELVKWRYEQIDLEYLRESFDW